MYDHFLTRSAVFKALAHPSRLKLVESLSSEAKCVYDLTSIVGADISTVSKHLSVLKNAGVLRDEKRGTQVFYHLRMPCVLNFMQCVDQEIASRAEWQLDMTRNKLTETSDS